MFWDSKEDENNFSEKKKKNGGVESRNLRFKISNDFDKYDLENALKSQKNNSDWVWFLPRRMSKLICKLLRHPPVQPIH